MGSEQDAGAPFGPGSREPSPAVSALPGFDPSRIVLHMLTEEEFNESARNRYAISGPFDIDRWPDSVRALSIPTRMLEVVDATRWIDMWDERDNGIAQQYADLIDAALNWDMAFVRLNSRSPKDAAYPGLPITCAGRQAMWWITASERCLDDSVTHWRAGAPIIICLRDWRPIKPEMEFRCFANNGEVVAVSRYDYLNPSQYKPEAGPKIMGAAKAFYARHLSSHYGDVVFDLFAPGSIHELLIELNPYGLSDPCCFGSYEEVEKGGIRFDRDSDGSGEAGETGTGSTEGDSAGLQASPGTDHPSTDPDKGEG